MERFITRSVILATMLMLGGITGLYAQQTGTQQQQNLLPEIDPQDIEIRSEFKARFPGLRRQPILGFNPDARVYQVASDRKPFMESQEERVANLPITDLSRPAAPDYNAPRYEPKNNGMARFGVGSFISPEVQLWSFLQLSDKTYVTGNLDYHSTSGHLDAQNSSFRFLNADAEFATKVNDKTALIITGGAQNDFNRLYELDNRLALPVAVPEGPRKEYAGYNASLTLRGKKNAYEGWEADAGARYFDLDMQAGDLSGTAGETVFNGSVRKQWAGGHILETYGIRAAVKGGAYRSAGTAEESWLTVTGGASYERLFNYTLQVAADVNVAYTSNAFEDKVYPEFNGEIKNWLMDDLTVTATLSAAPKLGTVEQLHHLNRFLNYGQPLRHTYTVKAGGEIKFEYLDGSSLYARVSYMNAQNYAYFTKTDLGPVGTPQPGYFAVDYMDADKVKGTAGVSHQLLPETLWINAEAYVQKPKLADGNDIPYEERWGVNTGVSVQPIEQLRIEAWADYVSERQTLSSGKLDGFFLLGSRVDLWITEKIGAYAKLLNLLSQEYEVWSGYRERPFQAYGGIMVKFN